MRLDILIRTPGLSCVKTLKVHLIVNSPNQNIAHGMSNRNNPCFLRHALGKCRARPQKKAGTLRSRPGFSAYASSGTNRLRVGPAAKYQNQQNYNESADDILIHKGSLLVVEMALHKLWTF
jgi:hypothetical protein